MGGQIAGYKTWEDAVLQKERADRLLKESETKAKQNAEERFKVELIKQLQGINENLDAIRSAIERNSAPTVLTSEQWTNLQSTKRGNR